MKESYHLPRHKRAHPIQVHLFNSICVKDYLLVWKKWNLGQMAGFHFYWKTGVFTSKTTLELQFILFQINSRDYIRVLRNSLLPFFGAYREKTLIFQQYNARIYVSNKMGRFLVNMLFRLKFIENVWEAFKKTFSI